MNTIRASYTYAFTPTKKWRAYKDRLHAECMLMKNNRQHIYSSPQDLEQLGTGGIEMLAESLKGHLPFPRPCTARHAANFFWQQLMHLADFKLVEGDNINGDPQEARRRLCGTAYVFTKQVPDVKLPKQAKIIAQDCAGRRLNEEQLEARVRNNHSLKTKQDPMRIFRYYKNLLIETGCLTLAVA